MSKKPEELQEWQEKFYCPDCKEEIWSHWAGQMKWCKCGASAVDQTPYSSRYIGKAKLVEKKKEIDNSGGYIGVEGWGYF